MCTNINANDIFLWGEVSKTNISQEEVNDLIKTYTNNKYPNIIKRYNKNLKYSKQNKIKQNKTNVFVKDDLMWQDNNELGDLRLNYIAAKHYCKKLKLVSRKDWRLPKYKELVSLINFTNYKPASIFGINFFLADQYWTQSKDINKINKYWVVDFNFGTTITKDKYKTMCTRCVRDISNNKGEF